MVRVFVNGSGVDVPAGSAALDAVKMWNPSAASEVSTGTKLITDSRGLPMEASTPVSAGSILRLIAKRGAGPSESEP
jgi:hypothetical protein